MEIKEQIERDLKYWKAAEKRHHGDGNTYLAGICQGSIDAYTTALSYFNQSPNTQMHTGACDCDTECVGWVDTLKGRICSVCGEVRR